MIPVALALNLSAVGVWMLALNLFTDDLVATQLLAMCAVAVNLGAAVLWFQGGEDQLRRGRQGAATFSSVMAVLSGLVVFVAFLGVVLS